MEEATFLTKFASQVTVIHRRGELRASRSCNRGNEQPEDFFEWNAEVLEVLGKDVGHVTGVRIRNNQTNEEKVVETDGYFAAIGHKPNAEMFKRSAGDG